MAAIGSAEVPFELPRVANGADDRHLYGLRARLDLARALLEAGDEDAGLRQAGLVETKVEATGDGFIFNSGKQIQEEVLLPAREGDGFKFGVRRQGHSGKSWALGELSRFYFERGDFEKACEAVRRIPSVSTQLSSARVLVDRLAIAGRLDEAAKYREDVLQAAKWDAAELARGGNLKTNYVFQFAKRTALTLLGARQQQGDRQAADALAGELRNWLRIRNASAQPPDIGDYRDLAVNLIRYLIETDRPEAAERVARACVEKWQNAQIPANRAILVPSFIRQRDQQLQLFEVVLKQPPGSDFPVTSGNLTRLPNEVVARFTRIEKLERSDLVAACEAYEELGWELLAEPARCKRYVAKATEALARLGNEPAALEIAAELQENLPQDKVQGCPVTDFQGAFLRFVDKLDIRSLTGSMNEQEDKLTTPERLGTSGLSLAKTYLKAGDVEGALRMVDKVAENRRPEDGYSRLASIIKLRYEISGELRNEEIRELVKLAQINRKRTFDRAQFQLASVAKTFIELGQIDWAEILIDAIAPIEGSATRR